MELVERVWLFFSVFAVVGGGFLAVACLVRFIINLFGGNAR